MNRVDRLSAILVQLQSRSLVKAQHIADRFDISLRTVYRDIRALEEAGIPIVGNPGVGYSLVEGFKLPPLLFTQAEAFAFLTAEKLVSSLTDSGSSEHYQSGMDKIRAVMRVADKDVLNGLDANMAVLKTHDRKPLDSGNTLQNLLHCISKKQTVKLLYMAANKQKPMERNVEPVGIIFSKTRWYLVAFCQTRNEYRTFRTDRIQAATALSLGFTKQHPLLKKFMEDICDTQDLVEVVIEVKKENAAVMGDDKYYHGLVSEKAVGDSLELSFLTFSLDRFARWYLSYADVATIRKPAVLKDIARGILQNISM